MTTGAKTYLEDSEVGRLEKAASNLRDKLLIRLLFRPGCRVSELVELGEENVDLAHGAMTIVHLKSRISLHCPTCQARLGRTHAFCPGCGAKIEGPLAREQEERRQRVVRLDRDTLRMLKEFIERGGPVQRGERKLIFGITRNQAWRVVHLAARKAGLPDLVNPDTGKRRGVSPHRLRDAFAVHALKVDDSGQGQRQLQEHMGHRSYNTTARYVKLSGKQMKDWYDGLWDGKGKHDDHPAETG